MKVRCVIFLFILGAAFACNKQNNSPEEVSMKAPVETVSYAADSTLKLIEMYCYSCHNPASDSHDNIIAPPLAAVKLRYRRMYSDRRLFIDSMVSFLQKPTAAKAKMPGAVTRFGVMPAIYLPEKQVRNISAYLYDQKVQEPAWFQDHMNAGQ